MTDNAPNLRMPEKPKKQEEKLPAVNDTSRWAIAAVIVIIALVASGLFIARALQEDTGEEFAETTEESSEVKEDEVEKVPLPDGKGEGERNGSAWTTWVTSGKQLLFSAPDSWDVMQSDGGQTSLISVIDDRGERQLAIFIGRSNGEGGNYLSLEDWRKTISDVETEPCLSRFLGGASMACFIEDGEEVFYGVFGDGMYARVAPSPREEEVGTVGEILQSVKFVADAQDAEGAIVIP